MTGVVKPYRKRPVEVLASDPLDGDNRRDVARWCGGQIVTAMSGTYIEIQTLEGVRRADVGDRIIRGVKGEFYPCKPDIFDATYEATS